ncbi:MAG TPA: ATP phosphoribosyltransferase regulatory subunit [Mariprofundaceae bacterium]|nr:ATP phosphoribosyltransferase regulatory subunit [Mariprofundaceae bacterium]
MNNNYSRPVIGLEDAFGTRAKQLRLLQMRLLELYEEAGYQEVIPPLVERPESLNCGGTGQFLADQTLVFSDPAGAGLLGIRPDITPQVARIAATRLQDVAVPKLCYSGPVMLSRPDSRTGSRQQWQTGIELLGEAGKEADVEVMHLAALSMHAAGFEGPLLQVGHLGILRALVSGGDGPLDRWVGMMMRRSPEDTHRCLAGESFSEPVAQALLEMASGDADREWLETNLNRLGDEFEHAGTTLLHLVEAVESRLSGEVKVQLDAAVMPRFLYHSGIVFAGFAAGAPQALLHGGRYDTLMQGHGRDMPATGFSFDLWAWLDAGAKLSRS